MGAVLRCYLCYSARVFAVPLSDDVMDQNLNGCWIIDFIPIVTTRSFDDICRQPVWRGPCYYVGDNLHKFPSNPFLFVVQLSLASFYVFS